VTRGPPNQPRSTLIERNTKTRRGLLEIKTTPPTTKQQQQLIKKEYLDDFTKDTSESPDIYLSSVFCATDLKISIPNLAD